MTDAEFAAGARGADEAAPRQVRVWDGVVRVFHWVTVSAFVLNFGILDPESALHRQVGYAMAAVLAVRLVWGLVGTRFARFAAFPPSLGGAIRHARALAGQGTEAPHVSHNPLGALMVYNLMGTLALIALTGWMMTRRAWFGVEWVEEAHEILANWAFFSALLHVGGVAVESRRSGINLVRAMITGWKTLPPKMEMPPR